MSVQDVYNNVFSTFHSVREYLAPVLKDSKFKETGCLTPEEFMAAGEFLVYKCPTWSWESGLNEKKRDYLAPDKQFLVTRNVPCLHRASQMEYTDDDNETQFIHNSSPATNEEDGWMYTHINAMENITHTIIGEEEEVERRLAAVTLETKPEEVPDMDDIPDMDDVFEEEEEEEDLARADTSRKQDNDNILQVRTYDVFITYDKYYQTPRVWLFGYDEQRRPLTSQQVFEDVTQDYVKKTVTIETHPHLNISLASIHPCKHAQVMKKIIERMEEGSTAKEEFSIRVDQYLIIFLKFMSSVVPTIDYDHTISA